MLFYDLLYQLALQEDTSHLFYSCGEDGLVYEIDLRHEKPNKWVCVIYILIINLQKREKFVKNF